MNIQINVSYLHSLEVKNVLGRIIRFAGGNEIGFDITVLCCQLI